MTHSKQKGEGQRSSESGLAMKRVVLLQSPAHLYEVVPIFYKELDALGYFEKFYLVTDQKDIHGLGDNVQVIQLEEDLGRANNFLKGLEVVEEEIFVMMCDDHVVNQSSLNLDRYYEIMTADKSLGRLQLSPPSGNYLKYMRRSHGRKFVPDYSKEYETYPKWYRWHVNFQPSLWRKDFFEYCVQGGENRNKLEMRAAARGRNHSKYQSGFIYEHAVRVENFYASCKVHTADPTYNRLKNAPHYREEFVRYAQGHEMELNPARSVYVKRADFVASVPLLEYIQVMNSSNDLGRFAVQSNRWRELYAKAVDQVNITFGN